jgi:cytochrome c-type biogenesis protein CcmE
MELTPRTGPDAGEPGGGVDAPAAPARRKGSRLPAIAVLVVVVLGLGFVLVKALGGATTFYRNVDEAVAQRDELGAKRFRLQGTVVDGTIERNGEGVAFMVTFNGVEIPVRHVGDPPEMFKANEAVLLEGHFADGSDEFDSDLMIVKHSEVYEAENKDRIKEAEQGGKVPISSTPDGATDASTDGATGQ